MSDQDEIRDPRRLRALAHPLRWKLIDLLAAEPTATATRCALVLDESVASCSYHLNVLAKYGYVEEAPGGQGREKPWRLVSRHQSFSGRGLDVDGRLAAQEAGDAFLAHEFDRLRVAMREHPGVPDEWRDATTLSASTTYLTPEEALEIRQTLRELHDRYEKRGDDPANRPEGSREVRLFTTLFLAPERPPAG